MTTPILTRRHFNLVAGILNGEHRNAGAAGRQVVVSIAKQLATAYQSMNPRFDRERFIGAVVLDS